MVLCPYWSSLHTENIGLIYSSCRLLKRDENTSTAVVKSVISGHASCFPPLSCTEPWWVDMGLRGGSGNLHALHPGKALCEPVTAVLFPSGDWHMPESVSRFCPVSGGKPLLGRAWVFQEGFWFPKKRCMWGKALSWPLNPTLWGQTSGSCWSHLSHREQNCPHTQGQQSRKLEAIATSQSLEFITPE